MRSRLPVVTLLVVGAFACNQRASKKAAPAAGSAAAVPGDAGPPQVQAAIAAAAAAASQINPAKPDGTLQLVGIDVLTDPKQFQARAAAAGPKPMEPILAATRTAVAAVDGARPGELGDQVVVWIAIRPGKKVHTWVATPAKPDGTARADVAARLTMAPAPEVTGECAFAVTFDRSGQRPRSKDITVPPELEAQRGKAGDASTPETMIDRAWTP